MGTSNTAFSNFPKIKVLKKKTLRSAEQIQEKKISFSHRKTQRKHFSRMNVLGNWGQSKYKKKSINSSYRREDNEIIFQHWIITYDNTDVDRAYPRRK